MIGSLTYRLIKASLCVMSFSVDSCKPRRSPGSPRRSILTSKAFAPQLKSPLIKLFGSRREIGTEYAYVKADLDTTEKSVRLRYLRPWFLIMERKRKKSCSTYLSLRKVDFDRWEPAMRSRSSELAPSSIPVAASDKL